MGARPLLREHRDWSLLPQSLRASQRPHESAQKLEREREEGEQIKRISSPESNSGEISESGINPENLPLNLISSFGSRSEQISASRKPLFLDTSTAPSMDLMIEEENENLTIERNTVPLPEDTTNIMEMIENASFDFTLPEPFPTTTLHITEQKTEVE